ncbi:MAG: RluA family pseudouridine synthase [Clostridia bacterium]|nr:RluA family pseudouridine synthase [Clostridia bacterium]
MKTFKADEDISLKRFTDNVFPQAGLAFSQLLKHRDIKINGERTDENEDLHPGDEVIYDTDEEQEAEKTHDVVYEDDNILICDKYAGVASAGLLFELNGYKKSGPYKGVNRLDKYTQGLIIFAKSPKAVRQLHDAKGLLVEKIYEAICVDEFKQDEDKLYAYIRKNPDTGLSDVFPKKADGSERIVTVYSVLERKKDLALVQITLHTDKVHQIRAHMAYIGCPILGDEKYGDDDINEKYDIDEQQMVSKKIIFSLSGELSYLNKMTFESSFSLDFQSLF